MADSSQEFSIRYVFVLYAIILTPGTVPVFAQTTTVSILPEFTSVPRQGDAVTLRCEVLGFQSSKQFLSWVAVFPDMAKILTWQGELDSRITDDSYTVVNNGTGTSDPTTVPEVHSVVIKPANQSHNGMYTCRVLEVRFGNSYVVVSTAQTVLTVYPTEIFPSCSPSGAASLTHGSPVSCTVMANTTAFVVAKVGSSSPEDWASSTLASSPGTRLTASVSTSEDGVIFNCSSVAVDFSEVSLDCQIGPLSLTSPTTVEDSTTPVESSPLPPAASFAGVVAAIAVLVVLLIVVIILVALILHRRKRRLSFSDKDRERQSTSGVSSPTGQHPAANGKAAPSQKPVPYALSVRHPSKQPEAPAVYAAVQHGRGKVAPQDPPDGAVYANVHKGLPKQSTEPVHYASVNKDRKDPRADTEPAHYAAVNKLKDPQGNTEPAHYAAVQRSSANTPHSNSKGDGLVYAELDLVNPPNVENANPVPKEVPTVYAVLADLK